MVFKKDIAYYSSLTEIRLQELYITEKLHHIYITRWLNKIGKENV